MERTIFMHAVLRCTDQTISTDFFPMAMYYAVWVYNKIPDMQSGYPLLEYGQGKCLSQCHKILATFMVRVVQPMFYNRKLQKPGVKTPKWDPRSQRVVNTDFINMHSAQVGLVINL